MWFKKILKQRFSNEKKINLLRFKSVWIVFIFSIFLYFLNFFILGNNIDFNFFIIIFPFVYFLLLLSMLYYFYFLIKIKVTSNKTFLIVLYILLLFIVLLLFLPFIFKSWLFDVLKYTSIFFHFVLEKINSLFSLI